MAGLRADGGHAAGRAGDRDMSHGGVLAGCWDGPIGGAVIPARLD